MAELLQESFTNEFGQVINVGDEVIYASTCTGSTSIRKGTFGGIYMGKVRKYRLNEAGGYVTENGRYVMDYVDSIVAVRVNDVPSKRFKYDSTTRKGTWESIVRTATLPLKRVYKIDSSLSLLEGKSF